MPAIVGFAATATFRASAPPRSGNAYHSLDVQVERFSELSGPPIVIFQDVDDPTIAATFGEVMCSVYQAFGAVGLVTSGAGRDLDQVRTLGFPVFTSGTICAHGYCHVPSIHVPVNVGGLTVFPDDLIHADRNGVTMIPRDIAGDIAEIGEEFVAAETIILDAVRTSRPSLKQLQQARAESHAKIEALRARVARKPR
jgi:regulator of RNase E activity RraA